jgi:2-dehydro-3-deoxyphosphogluconate aldolase / (4S)-4-hydroxy-2-oxoglutarate aldolase
MLAVELGADLVKLFPGSLGGPGHLRALRGPFPDLPFMPTGGVSVANARAWLDAGAVCLGAGGDLVSADLLARGDHAEITSRAAAFMSAVAPAPGS